LSPRVKSPYKPLESRLTRSASQTPRKALGALLAPMYGPQWSLELAGLLEWNPRTVERLGTPKMPLDARRLQLMADVLRQNETGQTGLRIAEWCESRIQQETQTD